MRLDQEKMEQFTCPCCGYLVFMGPPGTDEICPVCGWQDDVSHLRFPKCGGGANEPSLIEAQKNFATFGVSDPRRRLTSNRAPHPRERRDGAWRPIEEVDLPPDADGVVEGQPSYPAEHTELYYWKK
jgi:hypothetical protein